MEFCPNCGKRMVLKNTEKNGKILFNCIKCNFDKLVEKSSLISVPNHVFSSKSKIVVLGTKDKEYGTLPTVNERCPKCKNGLSYTWQVQTRGGDEGATQFFRCTKCNYTYRLYT